MPSVSMFDAFLAHEGVALFELRGNGLFAPVAALPAWCNSLWQLRNNKPNRLSEKSPFLENFLAEAEEFWNSKTPGAVDSGNWIEKDSSGRPFPLEASAFWLGGKRVLAIRNTSATFAQQQQLFQTARDSLLTHERLTREIQKKEILLHCIIHDLSQPLTSMRGCFDLLLGKKLAPEFAKFAQTGRRESQRQERMIRGILEAFSGDLAPQESANQAGLVSADLICCARRAVEQFSPAFTEHSIQISFAPYLDSERGWRVVGDAFRIDRIFGNLLENALRHSPDGSTVTVAVEDGGSSLTALVDDEGPGLANGTSADSLFALFSKGKDPPGKAGLGLYFCKITVERWGGSIGAENRPHGGSRFWFRLPRAVLNESPSSLKSSTEEKSSAAPASRADLAAGAKALRILVADDDEAVRELAMEFLRSRGHWVTGAADGRSALAAFERVKPDALLLDQNMPGMDGLELARVIRTKESQSRAGARVVLIGLSGNASAEDERRALEAGMDALLSKPFERDTLFRLIERSSSAFSETSSAAPPPREMDLRAHLTQITAGNEKLARKLVAGFLQDFPPKLAAIERAISRKNANELASSAHVLRGAFAIFNAQKSVAAARKLEAMGRGGHLQNASEAFRALSTDLSRLERELRELFPQAAARPKPRAASQNALRIRTRH
jgi:signal transduction histidine kinase/CheY-like chemotaxis protein